MSTTMTFVTGLVATDDRGTAMDGFKLVRNLVFLAGTVGGGIIADSVGFGAAFLAATVLEAGVVLVALPALLRLDIPQTELFRNQESD